MRLTTKTIKFSVASWIIAISTISVSGLSSAAPASGFSDATPVPIVKHREQDISGIEGHNRKGFGLANEEKNGRMSKPQEIKIWWPWGTCFYPPCPWEENPWPWPFAD